MTCGYAIQGYGTVLESHRAHQYALLLQLGGVCLLMGKLVFDIL